jgi:hypothetical protein
MTTWSVWVLDVVEQKGNIFSRVLVDIAEFELRKHDKPEIFLEKFQSQYGRSSDQI